jgi:CRISPR system Cascade subunit CasC
MSAPRFLQIHTLHSYTAALLNRDDTGQAKRLVYGGKPRTRISSQCLKRHWRMAETDPNALQKVAGYVDSFRSRELVTLKVSGPLRGAFADDIVDAIDGGFQKIVYGDKGDKGKKSRQTLLLGEPELNWLAAKAAEIAAAAVDAKSAQKTVEDLAKTTNFKVMADNVALPGGLAAALFGRMVTSDVEANIEAPVYVAHAFTVHAAESEDDYFTAVDDLKRDDDDSGADTIQETEINSGLFYGYVVIDLPGLIRNCGGDRDLASRVVDSLVHLIAEVSPGAKLGSTAPFGRADLMLVEAGDRQPRSLATAFRSAIPHDAQRAVEALADELQRHDEAYATGEARAHLSVRSALPGIDRHPLSALSGWAASKVADAPNG